MKNIFYRAYDKRYIGRKTINKHTYTVYGKTQLECRRKLQQFLKEYKSKILPCQTKTTTLSLYWDKWFMQDKEPFIVEKTKQDIKRCKLKWGYLLDLNIKKISKDLILEQLSTMKENREKEKSALYLKSVLKSAKNNLLIKINPFDNIRLKPPSNNKKFAFTYSQQVKIMNALKNEEIRPIILTYLITGLRKSELSANIDKDINLKTNILTAINLKGRNFVKRYKKIKLTQSAISLIMNNIDVFKKFTTDQVYQKFVAILKSINIKGSIVNLRHTFATNCFYLGRPELTISREMGHSKTDITKEIYTDIDYDLSKEKLLKLYKDLYNLE